MPRPCNASPSACTSTRRSQRSSRSWTRSSTAWLSGYARAKHSVSCSELSSLPLRQRARPQARRSRSRSAAASGPKVSRSLASRRMARARWGTRRVLLTRASFFAGDAVLLHHAGIELAAHTRRSFNSTDREPIVRQQRRRCFIPAFSFPGFHSIPGVILAKHQPKFPTALRGLLAKPLLKQDRQYWRRLALEFQAVAQSTIPA